MTRKRVAILLNAVGRETDLDHLMQHWWPGSPQPERRLEFYQACPSAIRPAVQLIITIQVAAEGLLHSALLEAYQMSDHSGNRLRYVAPEDAESAQAEALVQLAFRPPRRRGAAGA